MSRGAGGRAMCRAAVEPREDREAWCGSIGLYNCIHFYLNTRSCPACLVVQHQYKIDTGKLIFQVICAIPRFSEMVYPPSILPFSTTLSLGASELLQDPARCNAAYAYTPTYSRNLQSIHSSYNLFGHVLSSVSSAIRTHTTNVQATTLKHELSHCWP